MSPEAPKWTPCGEEDEKEEDDKEKRGCDKLNHFLRSLVHQPNHEKKLAKIVKDDTMKK